jgi:enterochelin esterase-like enzyme
MVAAAPAGARQSTALEGTISYASSTSRAVEGTLHYAVYLPPGYANGNRRYPVVYFLHGLPASTSYRNIGSIAAALELAGERARSTTATARSPDAPAA